MIQVVGGGGDAAPWYGVPLIAGVFLVVGAVLGFLFNWLADRRKARREDIRKWDDRVLELSAKVIALAAQVESEIVTDPTKQDEAQPLIQWDETGEMTVTMPQAWITFQMLTQDCAALGMVAPQNVKDAADTLHSATKSLLFGSKKHLGFGRAQAVFDASDALRQAIRTSFGLEERPSRSAQSNRP